MENGAIDRIERQLQKKDLDTATTTRRTFFSKREKERTRRGWERDRTPPRRPRRSIRLLDIAFILSGAFFIVSIGFAGYLFFSGSNTVSTRNVLIAVDGPLSARAGEAIALQVAITNRNTVPMELADLIVEFPPGTRAENDVTVEMPRLRESIGTLVPGETVNKTVRAILFGSAGAISDMKVTVEYRVPSSNAIFFSEELFSIPISQSPFSIVVGGVREVVSGQEVVFSVEVTSNTETPIEDVLLRGIYPPGFRLVSASPNVFAGDNVWSLGTIRPGMTREVTVRGTFEAVDGDERLIAFEVGVERADIEGEIVAPLAVGDLLVQIARPFISTALTLGGTATTEYVTTRSGVVRGGIRFTNNLPSRVQNVSISLLLEGEALDKTKVSSERGFYNSSQNRIIWSGETHSELRDMQSGASGVLSFSFQPLPESSGTFRNPEIRLTVTVVGNRVNDENVTEEVRSISSARVLVETDLSLESALSVAGGENPPRAEEATTYLVEWRARNTMNASANTSVSAVLPGYVSWGGSSDPAVSFNPVSGVVSWDIGDMSAGTAENTSFMVIITPSLSQVNNRPLLLSDQRIYGFDRFTRTPIERSFGSFLLPTPVGGR